MDEVEEDEEEEDEEDEEVEEAEEEEEDREDDEAKECNEIHVYFPGHRTKIMKLIRQGKVSLDCLNLGGILEKQ